MRYVVCNSLDGITMTVDTIFFGISQDGFGALVGTCCLNVNCHLFTAICRRHNHLLKVKKTTIPAMIAETYFPHRKGSVLVSRVLVRDRPLVPATLALGQPDRVL